MRLDKFSNPVFTEEDIFDALYQGYQFPSNKTFIVENNKSTEITNLEQHIGYQFLECFEDNLEIDQFDQACQENWNIPESYKNLDIESFILEQCSNESEHKRAVEELAEFKQRKMLNLLRWLKYFVDNCLKNNVLWGVGRGSSVASFVLYKIGVHNIDPLKYNLDWQEFLR